MSFVKKYQHLLKDSNVEVCTVIGFPNGNETLATKVFETKDAIENGADEIDMVINIGELKAKKKAATILLPARGTRRITKAMGKPETEKKIRQFLQKACGKTVPWPVMWKLMFMETVPWQQSSAW